MSINSNYNFNKNLYKIKKTHCVLPMKLYLMHVVKKQYYTKINAMTMIFKKISVMLITTATAMTWMCVSRTKHSSCDYKCYSARVTERN